MQLLSRNTYAFSPPPAKGGLIQVAPQPFQIETALFHALRGANLDQDTFFWVADEGVLYAEALYQDWKLPPSRILLVKARETPEVWRIGLEAIQTGLFRFLFLKAQRACQSALLRKLQLVSEKMRCEVFLFTPTPLPHWNLKETLHANPLPKKPTPIGTTGGKLLRLNPQGLSHPSL